MTSDRLTHVERINGDRAAVQAEPEAAPREAPAAAERPALTMPEAKKAGKTKQKPA